MRALTQRRRPSPAGERGRLGDTLNRIAFCTILLATCCLLACGGVVGNATPAAPTVSVTPASAQPLVGAAVQFTAAVQNASNPSVNWQVNGVSGGNGAVGTVDPTGRYVAPNLVPTPAMVTVAAVLQSDSTIDGTASVTIERPNSIQGPLTISPALSAITPAQTVQLQVTTPGVSNSQVNWATAGCCVNATGLFAPSAAGSYTLTATLKTDSLVLGSAQVAVTGLAGVFTWRNDSFRSGQNSQELALTPANVNSSTFGKLFSCPVDGQVYAQPLYVANLAVQGQMHNAVFVATEKDTVFAFDADTAPCQQLWQTSLIPAMCQQVGCSGEQPVSTPNFQITSSDISPFVGITGTPVISSSTSALYVVAKTEVVCQVVTAPTCKGLLNPTYNQRLFALDLVTGQPKIQPAGVLISTPIGTSPSFSSTLENQGAALLLDNGQLFVSFGALGEQGAYHGWIFDYDASSLAQTSFFDATSGGEQGGIWMSGGGPSADPNHNLFATVGFETFNNSPGTLAFGDSFVRLTAAGGLAATDFFTPCDQATQTPDTALGSTAAVLVNSAWSTAHPDVMIGGAKNGSLYVVDRDSLGGYDGGTCPDNFPQPLQVLPVGDGAIFGSPLFWNNEVYVAAGGGALKAFAVSQGALAPSPTQQSPETLGSQGATPVISANGTNNGIVWLIDTSRAFATPITPAILRAYDASNLAKEIYNSAMNSARDSAGLPVKFTVPTVANAKVYVGTASPANSAQGELDVYGFLPPQQ